jgi:hypothetical protein
MKKLLITSALALSMSAAMVHAPNAEGRGQMSEQQIAAEIVSTQGSDVAASSATGLWVVLLMLVVVSAAASSSSGSMYSN